MAKSDARFEYKANLGRTDHDLSQRLGFTSASGMLLPIWYDYATPGDSYYIQHDLPLLRSVNLAAPAMVDVKVHYETFFVPMQMIYEPFENCLFSLKQTRSNFYTTSSLVDNNLPLFNYAAYVTNILTNYMTNDIHADAFRMADLFGLCPDNFAASTGTLQNKYAPSFFPWQILAYHTIWEYYFRLDDKTDFNHQLCNIDSWYSLATPQTVNVEFMEIHQRPWNFDYFTSIYRSPIVSDANLQLVMTSSPYQDLLGSFTTPIRANGSDSTQNSDNRAFSPDLTSAYSEVNAQGGISTASIRQMFLNEKLAMITGRTRKNYDSQVLAHYGISVPHDVKHDITMIHHDEYELKVQEVTSLSNTATALGNGSPLGELAGKGFSAGNGEKFKFTAPCHGVMMTIFSIEPNKRYISGFDRLNAVTDVFDFPTPEYDRLGNVPMFRYECGYNIGQTTYTDTDIIGWKERYYQNKRKYDKCTYAFASGTGVGFNNYSSYMLAERPFGLATDYNDLLQYGIEQRPDLENRFYIERNAVDTMCMVDFSFGWKHSTDTGVESWSNTPWLVYARDPFIVNSFIKAKKVSWMSKDGEPIYNF